MSKNIVLHKGNCLVELDNYPKNTVDLIITDPPYGVGFKNELYDDSEAFIDSQRPYWFNLWFKLLKDECYLIIFVGVKNIHKWIKDGIDAGFTYKNILATRSFNNGAVTPNNNFGFQFQPILIFSKGKGKEFNKVDFIPTSLAWYEDKRNKNPQRYTYKYPNFIKTEWAFATAKNSTKTRHPNEKNVKLLEFIIKVLSNPKDTILDTFMGSGSTGVACVHTDRDFIGVEIDTNHYNKALEYITKTQVGEDKDES